MDVMALSEILPSWEVQLRIHHKIEGTHWVRLKITNEEDVTFVEITFTPADSDIQETCPGCEEPLFIDGEKVYLPAIQLITIQGITSSSPSPSTKAYEPTGVYSTPIISYILDSRDIERCANCTSWFDIH